MLSKEALAVLDDINKAVSLFLSSTPHSFLANHRKNGAK